MTAKCIACLLTLITLIACSDPASLTVPAAPVTAELVLYDWADDYPPEVLTAFTAETGILVDYRTYESQEEAVANLRAGQIYDVVVLENQWIPGLVTEGRLAEIDYHNVPNFKNISPNFRNLAYDPGNRHSVPFSWGTAGLIVYETSAQPISRWSDLWDTAYQGRVVVWLLQRDLIGIALKSLGYSANSEAPGELSQALEKLHALRSQAAVLPYDPAHPDEVVHREQAAMAVGWAGDVLRARDHGDDVQYILPLEGTLLWGDNWVIPADSLHKMAAEQFLNYLLRPEVNARIVDYIYYATANEAAYDFINPELLNDPVIFPPTEALQDAEILMPLSAAGQALNDRVWAQFLAEIP
jgi:spermidine/putrescine transport system substrate-binding protein